MRLNNDHGDSDYTGSVYGVTARGQSENGRFACGLSVFLQKAQAEGGCCSHCTGEETEAGVGGRLSNLSRVPRLVRGKAWITMLVFLSP